MHYESGKLWLALDDMPRARDGFARAALMPSFSAAFSNLGATPQSSARPLALDAFEQAQAHDPDSYTVLNNVGVVSRARAARSIEAALRRVVELSPGFVFGHYNLGHTLFLAGSTPTRSARKEGQRLDPERTGGRDAASRSCGWPAAISPAPRRISSTFQRGPPLELDDLLLEACEIAHA